MTDIEKFRLHASISGRVQGVGFRAFVLDQARLARATGWVRNRWDDTVEVVAEGERSPLERLLSALRRGPPAAYVSDVKVDWGPATGEFDRFSVYPTS
jgi:acylphosphatase